MDKHEWLSLDYTKELLKKLATLEQDMKDFMVNRSRIGETTDATAQQFCWSNGYVESTKDILEYIKDIKVVEEVEVKTEGQEYSDA